MELTIADAILKGLLVGLFMAISVGPTLFAIIRYSLSFSYKAGIAFILGVSVSDAIYVTLANIATTWLQALKPYEKYIAYGGAAALMMIGLAGLLKKHKPTRPTKEIAISGGHYFKIWLSGFLVNTLNPGVLITWLGAVTIIATAPALYRFVLFGTCLIIILSIDFSKVFLADRIKRLLTARRIIYMHRFSSACLLLIGVSLLITTLFNVKAEKKGKETRMDKILSGLSQPLQRRGEVEYL
jgi:threonine/homoserine/homoserine lactone efflux protein